MLGPLIVACGGNDGSAGAQAATEAATEDEEVSSMPEGLTATVDHIFMPLDTVTVKVLEGEETDPDTGETITLRVEEVVQAEPKTINGVEVRVIEAKDIEDGELIELTLDYYAQGPDGTVYYVGEDVDDYEDGKVVGHGGAWLAGVDGNLPGIFMLPEPKVSDVFEQERAPGIAEDTSTVIALDVSIDVPAGSFTGCMETEDLNPLDPEAAVEHKFYCPGVGLVREESENSFIDLVSYE